MKVNHRPAQFNFNHFGITRMHGFEGFCCCWLIFDIHTRNTNAFLSSCHNQQQQNPADKHLCREDWSCQLCQDRTDRHRAVLTAVTRHADIRTTVRTLRIQSLIDCHRICRSSPACWNFRDNAESSFVSCRVLSSSACHTRHIIR